MSKKSTADGRIYAYSYPKEFKWVSAKVRQFKKLDPKMSISKVINALIKEKLQSEDHKDWDPRLVVDKPRKRSK